MLILPLKFVGEEGKKTVGTNLYHLAKLSHLGLPVVDSVIAIPPVNIFEKVLNKYLRHNMNIRDHLNNLKTEILSLPIPESLEDFAAVNVPVGKHKQSLISSHRSENKFSVHTDKLWKNLLEKWSYEIISKIERGRKKLIHLTPQLVIFSANFAAFGKGFFDEDRNHVSIKTEKGEINFNILSDIENLILLGNKKLLLPQIYFWAIEEGKVKIVKVMPFTQSLPEQNSEEEKIVSAISEKPKAKTATKVLLDFNDGALTNFNADAVLLKVNKLDPQTISEQISKIEKFDSTAKIIFFPDLKLDYEKTLEFAKNFLFFKNKKNVDGQIVLPETFSIDEFLNLKREFASLGIYSKGSLKIWKQFNTVSDFINLEQYLDAGFDGAIINLDKICKIVCGVESEIALKELRVEWLSAIEKFLKESGLSKIIKNHKQVLITGSLTKNEELLSFFIKSGVWGIAFENGMASSMRDHIGFLEKQTLKKLSGVEIQH